MRVKSVCPYCGCGCRLTYVVEDNKILKVLPDKEDRVSEGSEDRKNLLFQPV